MKKISVIIPVYDSYSTLTRCVNSILKSTYKNIEVLIIDDGSEEKTRDLCDQIATTSPLIKVFHQKNNGVSTARNTGIDNADGDYITFIDADDTITENMLESLFFECENTNSQMAICGYKEILALNYKKEINCIGNNSILSGPDILKCFFEENTIGWNVWAKLYRRELIGKIRFRDNRKIAEDMFFVFEILKHTDKICILGQAFYNYYKSDNSAMSSSQFAKYTDTFELIEDVYTDQTCKTHFSDSLGFFYLRYNIWFFRFAYPRVSNANEKELLGRLKDRFFSKLHNIHYKYNFITEIQLFALRYLPAFFFSCLFGISNEKIKYKDLINILKIEKKYYPNSWFDYISFNQRIYNYKLVSLIRKCEFYRYLTRVSINPIWKLLYWINRAHKNRLGVLIGVEIPEDVFSSGLVIHHNGNIVVNGSSIIGNNCQLHGDNCIGNSGKSNELKLCPIIGDNVDIGVGAKIIGDVIIADDIKIGANSVVTKSFLESGITIAGIPARKIEHSKER